MKRIFLAIAILALLGNGAEAKYKNGYYDQLEGKKKEALKAAAKACVKNHRSLEYYDLPYNWQYSDVYPELFNGNKRWWEMYSNETYYLNGDAKKSFSYNNMQREHSVPKSWWKKGGDVEYTPAYTDMWNLYPSDGSANQAKFNYAFGEVSGTPDFDNGCSKVGNPRSGQGGGSPQVFEPDDEYKGDFARTIFYMATVYDDLPWAYTYMFNTNTWPTLRSWAYSMLLQWARTDKVSQKEIDRNNAVENQQGNRNPFIDFPELAEYIWGTRTSEVFRIADQGGSTTDPITGDPELTAPVSGESLDLGQAGVGATVSAALEIKGSNLTAPLSVSVTGADRSMFKAELKSIPAASINSQSVYYLNILFTPTSEGEKIASLVLYDGGLPSSIAVRLQGEGCPVPELSTLTAYDPTEVTGDSYVANWSAAPETIDYYVVTRVRYLDGDVEGETLESDTNSLLVNGRDSSVTETYQVQSSRLGFLSEPSNTVTVKSDSGVEGVDAPLPIIVAPERDGFRILCQEEGSPVNVYNAAGQLVRIIESASNGAFYPLPGAGVYVVSSPALRQPVKIMVFDM